MRFPTLAILLLLFFIAPARAESFSDPSLNFTLQIPAGFQQLHAPPGSVAIFATSDPANGVPDATVGITRLGGTIGREHLDPSKLPFSNTTVSTSHWKSFDLDAISARTTSNGTTLAVCLVQIPLKQEAIQITVAVPPAQQATALPTLQQFLSTLDGPTNWLSAEDRAQRLGEGLGAFLALLAGIYLFTKRLRSKAAASSPPPPANPTKV